MRTLPDSTDDVIEKYSVGQPVPRTEDPRLLTGRGNYTDDLSVPGQVYGYVFRSPYAHAKILSLDVTEAAAQPGVLLVLTGEDLQREGVQSLPCRLGVKSRDGSPLVKPFRPSLALDRVRYRGEAVAMVVAETLGQARDAAELIEFDAEPLPAVTDSKEAGNADAPQLHDEAPGNLALDWEVGEPDAVEQAFASAHHVSTVAFRNNRIVVAAMEPRAAVAVYDKARDHFTLHIPSQGVFGLKGTISEAILGVSKDKMRIVTKDVGGSFGMKSAPYPEYIASLVASRRLGRPVKWCDERSDSFLSDQHGRDSWVEASIAFDAEGKLLAGRVIGHANVGAYLSPVGPNAACGNINKNFPGLYRLPHIHVRTMARFTNTTPIGAYRGAGRPEGVYYMERLMDTAAREMGIDPVELRRRNFVSPEEMPYKAASGVTYDSGEFPQIVEAGLKHADWDGFEARRRESLSRGRLRGRGLACYLESTGPQAVEMGELRFEADGTVTMVSGSLNYGQGHASTFAQIVSTYLGVPFEKLRLLQGDSDELIAGSGTGGSRTVIAAGTLLVHAADLVIENGRKLAGHVLEAATEDIEFDRGIFRIAGTDRAIDIMALSERVRAMGPLPDGLPQGLDAKLKEETPPSAYPNGCHVAEVEVTPETGEVALVRYSVIDDFGTLINPLLVEGQVHGGIVQGLGQALLEHTVYDTEGQLVAGSFMDYTMPRADDVPDFAFASRPVPAKTNPLGAKGCGEAGTTGALPAIMNALVDVLVRQNGITHIDMPATPERVWSALNRKG
jgi:carbon-monoxide dehydrogenase large subunit